MKIKILRGVIVGGEHRNPGDVVETKEAAGKLLVLMGKATAVEQATAPDEELDEEEDAAEGEVEQATAPAQGRKRKAASQ